MALVHAPSTSSRGMSTALAEEILFPSRGRQAQGEGVIRPSFLPDGAGGKGRPASRSRGAQIAPEEDRLGEGGGHLTQGHAQDDGPTASSAVAGMVAHTRASTSTDRRICSMSSVTAAGHTRPVP